MCTRTQNFKCTVQNSNRAHVMSEPALHLALPAAEVWPLPPPRRSSAPAAARGLAAGRREVDGGRG